MLIDKNGLSTVLKSIKSLFVQPDFTQDDPKARDFIKNKPTIPTIPVTEPFLIRESDDDCRFSNPDNPDTRYGKKVLEALLAGRQVYYVMEATNTLCQVLAFQRFLRSDGSRGSMNVIYTPLDFTGSTAYRINTARSCILSFDIDRDDVWAGL